MSVQFLPERMKGKGHRDLADWAWAACSLGLLLVAATVGSCKPSDPAPRLAGTTETRPVLLSRLDLDRLSAEVVCVYNFSSW